MDRRYQVFISSTYEDLREERQQATQAILEMDCFPSGMELFPASDASQWELIQRVIVEADYYVIIVGGRYGSLAPSGLSYTEMEYDFAVQNGIPVVGFVKTHIEDLKSKFVESSPPSREKLEAFRKKVMTRHCRPFGSAQELGLLVMKSLTSEIRTNARTGWIKASLARTDEDRGREDELRRELESAKKQVRRLKRQLRDGSIEVPNLPREKLASGSDEFQFTIIWKNNEKKLEARNVQVTWDDILRTIGPSMFGYAQRKGYRKDQYGRDDHSRPVAYTFEASLEHMVRTRIIDEVQNRRIDIQPGQVDAVVIQLKQLGYVQYEEIDKGEGKETFRGITLTEEGERRLTALLAQMRPTADA